MKALGGILLAAILYFAWGMVSHMVLPYHRDATRQFRGEPAVAAAVQAAAPESGYYFAPYPYPPEDSDEAAKEKHQADMMERYLKGPTVFAVVNLEGGRTMKEAMAYQGACSLAIAILLAGIFHLGKVTRPVSRYLITLASAGVVIAAMVIPYWNWFKFPDDFTIAYVIDIAGGFALAGIPLAALSGRSKGK